MLLSIVSTSTSDGGKPSPSGDGAAPAVKTHCLSLFFHRLSAPFTAVLLRLQADVADAAAAVLVEEAEEVFHPHFCWQCALSRAARSWRGSNCLSLLFRRLSAPFTAVLLGWVQSLVIMAIERFRDDPRLGERTLVINFLCLSLVCVSLPIPCVRYCFSPCAFTAFPLCACTAFPVCVFTALPWAVTALPLVRVSLLYPLCVCVCVCVHFTAFQRCP